MQRRNSRLGALGLAGFVAGLAGMGEAAESSADETTLAVEAIAIVASAGRPPFPNGTKGTKQSASDKPFKAANSAPLAGVPRRADGMPLVSICLPTYKRTAFLRGALESALGQTYPNIEVFVSDDTPGEEIRSIVEGFISPRLRYQKNDPALGFVPKLNNFLTEAKGDWLVILCDDDLFAPEFIEHMVANARQYPQASLLRSRNDRIDVQGRQIRLDPVSPEISSPTRFILDLFRPQSESFWVNLTGYMFRPQQLRELGGFTDLYAARHADRLAWAALATLGPVICDQRPLCKIRLHGSSVSSALESGYSEAINATQTAKGKFIAMLDQLEAQPLDDEQRREIASTREMLAPYVNEHITRALRHSLVAELKKPDSSEDRLHQLRSQWYALDLPVNRLTRLIFLVSTLPRWMRQPVVTAMLSYKQAYMH